MALEECVSHLICFRHFLDEWRQELGTKNYNDSSCSELLTATSEESDGSTSSLPFETFAARAMGCDIVAELDADCKYVGNRLR